MHTTQKLEKYCNNHRVTLITQKLKSTFFEMFLNFAILFRAAPLKKIKKAFEANFSKFFRFQSIVD